MLHELRYRFWCWKWGKLEYSSPARLYRRIQSMGYNAVAAPAWKDPT